MHKPSVKNSVLIVIAIAIIGAALVVSKYENRAYAGTVTTDTQNTMQLPVISISGTSTDTDVAYSGNWQKTLTTAMKGVWGTSSTSASGSNQPLTPTQQFGRALFSQYVEAQNAGEDVTDPNTQQAIATEVLTDGTVLPGPKVYTMNDIKIESDNSNSAMVTYGTAVGAILENNQTNIPEYETDIVQNSMNSNDPTILQQLNPFITSYQKILNQLLATPVPSNMSSLNLAVINAMSELVFADESFQKIYTDALTGLAGVGAYKQGIADLPVALVNVKKYFVAENVTFDPKGPGSVFNIQK